MARKKKDYAVYKGDEFVCLGTLDECAEFTGMKKSTIKFYASEIGRKRSLNSRLEDSLIVIVVEDD